MPTKIVHKRSLAWIAAVAVLVVAFTAGFATSAVAFDPFSGTCPTEVCSDMTGYEFEKYCYRWDGVQLKCEQYVNQSLYGRRCYTNCVIQ